jgi:hypothetical protein
MTASITRSGDSTKVYIDGLLHLYVADRITMVQAWKHENTWWKIEVQTASNTTTLEYDCFGKWQKILTLLNNS